MRRAAIALALVLAGALALWRFWPRPHHRDAPPPDRSFDETAAPARRGSLRLAEAARADDVAGRPGPFSGRVASTDDGRGVSGAEITLAHAGSSYTVSCDGAGQFRFLPPAEGEYRLEQIIARGFLASLPDRDEAPLVLTARAGARLDGVTLWLEPERPITARVVAPSGQPVAGAELLRLGDEAGPRWRSGTDGEAKVAVPQDALIEARAAGYSPGRASVDLMAIAAGRVTVRLGELGDGGAPSASIAGRVVDGSGAPIVGAHLAAHRRGRGDLGPAAEADTGSDGGFRLADLEPGEYGVSARARGVQRSWTRAAAPSDGLTITLEAGGALAGAVRDAAGRAVAAFTVVLTPRRGALARGDAQTTSILDGNGRYRVDGLAPGRYAATVAARGYASPREVDVEVGDGDAHLDFTVTRGGRLLGRVTDAQSRAPIGGALVTLEGSAGDSGPLPTQTSARSNGDGRFTLDGLAPGLASIVVAAERHHGRILSGLRSDGATDLGPVEVALDPAAPGEEPHIELVGIGAVLSAQGEVLLVGQVFPGSGAEEVGIGRGDAIVAVDGDPVVGLGFIESVQRIRGPENSSVRLTLRRGDEGAPFEVEVPRRRVHG